ncbi:MAG: IS3 family transposase [Polyangiaceae bacterium]|nr:IS3 family transposase [Polyangiaceae bacterium]
MHRKEWATHAELEAAVFEYIEVYYNRKRIHLVPRVSHPVRRRK